jgi:hypothetical protein
MKAGLKVRLDKVLERIRDELSYKEYEPQAVGEPWNR